MELINQITAFILGCALFVAGVTIVVIFDEIKKLVSIEEYRKDLQDGFLGLVTGVVFGAIGAAVFMFTRIFGGFIMVIGVLIMLGAWEKLKSVIDLDKRFIEGIDTIRGAWLLFSYAVPAVLVSGVIYAWTVPAVANGGVPTMQSSAFVRSQPCFKSDESVRYIMDDDYRIGEIEEGVALSDDYEIINNCGTTWLRSSGCYSRYIGSTFAHTEPFCGEFYVAAKYVR